MKITSLLFATLLFSINVISQISAPKPIGNEKNVAFFFSKEMQYPEKDLENGTKGKVLFNFNVDTEGNVSEIVITEGVSPEIDAEALRLFKKLNWTPATNEFKQPISYASKYAISFNPKKYKRFCKRRGYNKIRPPHSPIDTSLTVYSFNELSMQSAPQAPDFQSVTKFLSEHITLPENAKNQGVKGQVKLSFIVEPSGNISNLEVIEHVGAGCTEEAIRLLKLLKWQTGQRGNFAVRARSSFTVNFDTKRGSFQYVPAD